jgi:phosphomethylpyrimidine synthase
MGVIGARLAAHAGDLVKGVKNAWEWDREMSFARKRFDWERQAELSLDPDYARQVHTRFPSGETCSMCGDYCALKLVQEYLGISA